MRESAQTSLDFLTAITLFSLVTGYAVFNLISVTAPINDFEEVYKEAERITELLITSPGLWENGSNSGNDWENHLNDVVYVGLNSGDLYLNALSEEKIEALSNSDLELNTSFHYRLEMTSERGDIWIIGEDLPEGREIAKIVRIITTVFERAVIEGNELAGPNPENDKVLITMNEPPSEDIEIIITNFDPSQIPFKINYVKLNGVQQSNGEYFHLYLNEVETELPVTISSSDAVIRIVITLDNPSLNLSGSNEIEIKFVDYLIKEGTVSYEESYERVFSRGVMTLWMWR
jgi:hypothetical protein